MIFILVFGFIGGRTPTIKIAFDKHSDTINPIFKSLQNSKLVKIVSVDKDIQRAFNKGQIGALINISPVSQHTPKYVVNVTYSNIAPTEATLFRIIFNQITASYTSNTVSSSLVQVHEHTTIVREYKSIDFILPGQLGFALLSSGVFGTAFAFLNLRVSLVIKRFFATPVRKSSIILGEGISRIVFALLGAIIIIAIGRFCLGYTLINGWTTLGNMLVLSIIALIVFMGFGFVVSGIAKNEHAVPPFANIITLPQFLLSGTFFSIDNFPSWLQPISRALPLTHLNDALRQVAFEGVGLCDVWQSILILVIWGVFAYTIAIKVFKWE